MKKNAMTTEINLSPSLKRAFYQKGFVTKKMNLQLLFGFILLFIPVLLFFIHLLYQPYTVSQMNPLDRFQGVSLKHWFGTDNYGRDVFVRTMSALPLTILISLGINAIGAMCGFLIGALSGYYGKYVDFLLSRFTDALLAIPIILMGLLFVATFGNGIWQVIVALGIMFIPSYARVIRSGFLELKQRNFIKRLQLVGASSGHIIFRHFFPLLKNRILASFALGFANAILAESSLSFLGLGVPPGQITWGRMLKDAQGFIFQESAAAIFPGLMIVLLVLGSFFINNAMKQLTENRGLGQ